MKKYIFSIILLLSFGFFGTINAQSSRDINSSYKSDDQVLVAYPNPTKDFLVIRVKDSKLKIKTVSFYSILGNQVMSISVNLNSAELNLERLRPGKYLMKYTLSDNTQKIKQIVKL